MGNPDQLDKITFVEITDPNNKVIFNKTLSDCTGNFGINCAVSPISGAVTGKFSVKNPAGTYMVQLFYIDIYRGKSVQLATNTAILIAIPPTPTPTASGASAANTTDDILGNGLYVSLLIMIAFAAMGHIIGELGGAVIGFGSGFIFCAIYGLVPLWALFLFAIVVIVVLAIFMGNKITGD